MPESLRQQPSRLYRWIVLIFVSLAMFGNYYFYDALSPLADVLQRQLRFSDENIGLLNSFYSIAPIATVLIGGFIIDRIGARKALLLFGVICLIGAIVTASTPLFWVMASGRLIFGMGAESLIVAVTTAIAKWFRGKELSFAFGINLTISRLGTWLAQNSPTWAKPAYSNWQTPWVIGVGFVTLCVIGPIFYWMLEARAERQYELGQAGQTDKIVIGDIFKFGTSYWYLVILCTVFYAAIFPFETFAVKFFIDSRHTSREFGGFVLSILTFFTMFGTPAFGLLTDKVGKRALLMSLGALLLIPSFLIMAYSNVSLYVPMSLMGLAFSLVPAIIWPSVAYIVDQKTLGTAYGLMTMIQNIGMASFNWILGWANDRSGAGSANPAGYQLMLQILTALGILALVFAILLRRRETGPHGHGLETITTASTAAA
ncbi:MAG TPA: MFS transporter [Terriglobales bacterium]|nr:MFS transporter [Terriglobales bacterium]